MMSVIIPTLEEERYLPRLLEDLNKQDVPPGEVIVVDACSEDSTASVAKKFKARVFFSRRRNAAAQRNIGARHAKGGILVFIDADMRLPSCNLLREVKWALAANVGATAPSHVLQEERTWKDRLVCAPMNLCAKVVPRLVGRGGFMAVGRRAFFKVGGFDERRAVSEDVDFFRRLGVIGSVVCLKSRVEESGRRYRGQGHAKTIVRWIINGVWAAVTGYSWDKEWRPVR